VGARLTGADLTAAVLEETDLTGAVFNKQTRWPDKFDPEARGAVQEGAAEE